ncbi:MutS-related protein, partial [Staphylococcus epidermidis]
MHHNHYLPNHSHLHHQTFIYLITPPNISRNSTYITQLPIITIIPQIPPYLPSHSPTLPIFHQIFTTIPPPHHLLSPKTTFILQILQPQKPLTYPTQNTLIIFHQIPTPTSTYHRLPLPQAMIQYLPQT